MFICLQFVVDFITILKSRSDQSKINNDVMTALDKSKKALATTKKAYDEEKKSTSDSMSTLKNDPNKLKVFHVIV